MSEGGQDIPRPDSVPTVDEVRKIVDGDSPDPDANADKKTTEPASEASKKAVITELDKKLQSPQTFSGVKGLRSIDLKPKDDQKDNVSIMCTRWDDGVEKAAVIIVHTEEIGGTEERTYTFKNTHDGLQVEPMIHAAIPDNLNAIDNPEAASTMLGGILREVGKRGESEVQQRELGLAFFSEQDAEDLAGLLRESEPVIYEDD